MAFQLSGAGIPIDEAVWKRSWSEIEKSIATNHGIRYWTLKGTGTGDASLRTSSMALALTLSGRQPKVAQGFGDYLLKCAPRAREAHAVGSLGLLLSAPALWAIDQKSWQLFCEEWRWYLTLMVDSHGRVRYIGGKRNNGGDSYLGKDAMACVIALMLLACPDQKLELHRASVAPTERF